MEGVEDGLKYRGLRRCFTTKDNFIKYGVYGGIVKQLFILVHASFKST